MTNKNSVNLVQYLKDQGFQLKRLANNNYRINPCPVCGHKDHFTIYQESNSFFSFSGCCKGGDLIDYFQQCEGLSSVDAMKKFKSLYGESVSNKDNHNNESVKNTTQDYQKRLMLLWGNNQEDSTYFQKRGITTALIEKYKLCIGNMDAVEKESYAIFPIWHRKRLVYFTQRALREDQFPRYKNARGSASIFGLDWLDERPEDQNEVIFVCEGIMDALSIERFGYKALALGGTGHFSKLIEALDQSEFGYDYLFICASDNDESGDKLAQDMEAKLGANRFLVPPQYKDVNEWLLADCEDFSNGLEAMVLQCKSAKTEYSEEQSLAFYLDTDFWGDLAKSDDFISSGFSNLDCETGGFYPGLVILGGISSIGKTTFLHQIADQMAEAGQEVLFFSLEQSKSDMVCKSLARQMAKRSAKQAISALKILEHRDDEPVKTAFQAYKPIAKHLQIIEGRFGEEWAQIKDEVMTFIGKKGKKPVLMIDYLQIIGQEKSNGMRERIDETLRAIKVFARDEGLLVFLVSSLNRGNYLAPVDFESFKESGGIEYSADIILGLQPMVINQDLFNQTAKLKEKRETIRAAKAQNPRKIELVCLKNRYGKAFFSCQYDYYPAFDLFVER